MATPTIPNGEEYFFPIIYEGNGAGQRVGKFVPFTDSGTIANSVIFNSADSAKLERTPSSNGSGTTFTISFWFKPTKLATQYSLFDNGPSGSAANIFSIIYNSDNTILIHGFDSGGSFSLNLATNRTFEDTSKFYHILVAVDTTQGTSSNRVKLYVDGTQITSLSSTTYPGSSATYGTNQTSVKQAVGYYPYNGTRYLDGYIAEFNLIDGQALTPSTFGITDTSSGRWVPKALTGITYGTNGFRLQFGSSSALGDDTSGNNNDLSVSNLVAGDQTTDSPTQNSNTFGSVFSGVTVSEGNLTVNTGTSGSYIQAVGQPAFGVSSGKWYWEVKITTVGMGLYGWKDDGSQGGSQANQGATSASGSLSTGSSGQFSAGSWFIDMDYSNEVNYTTVSTNDVLMFAMDLDSGKGYCGKNGTWFNSANPANGTGSIGGCHRANGINKFYPCANRLDTASVGEFNFGQKSFAYTAPTGFSTLQQDNLPETAKGVSGLVWTKNRDATDNHQWYDSSRGKQLVLASSAQDGESTVTDGLQKFLAGGQQIEDSDAINTASESFVSWNWVANGGTTASNTDGSISSTVQANTTAGFSIVQYTGTGSAATVGHGLSKKIDWMIIKELGNSNGWIVSHKGLTSQATYSLNLSNTSAPYSDAGTYYWNNTAPTSSVFSIATDTAVNRSSGNYVAYCWSEIDGFSKFGKFVGNGNADGPFIYTGFKPAWIVFKANRVTNWYQNDGARSPFNPVTIGIDPNTTAVEYDGGVYVGGGVDYLSNGFKIRQGTGLGYNYTGEEIYYMCFAKHPFVGDGTNPVTAR